MDKIKFNINKHHWSWQYIKYAKEWFNEYDIHIGYENLPSTKNEWTIDHENFKKCTRLFQILHINIVNMQYNLMTYDFYDFGNLFTKSEVQKIYITPMMITVLSEIYKSRGIYKYALFDEWNGYLIFQKTGLRKFLTLFGQLISEYLILEEQCYRWAYWNDSFDTNGNLGDAI